MGGSINIVKRGSDKKVIAFKIHTSNFEELINVPKVNSEQDFDEIVLKNNLLKDEYKDEIENENFYNDDMSLKGINAPCEYGIILFDYYKKNILACNNYNAFLKPTYFKLLEEYPQALKANFILKTCDVYGNILETQNVLEKKHSFYSNLYMINEALRIGEVIYRKKTYSNMNLMMFIEKSLSINLQGKDVDSIINLLKERLSDSSVNTKNKMRLSEYNNVEIVLPDMKIIVNDVKENIDKIYEYVKSENFILSPYEVKRWEAEIQEQQSRK